MSRLKEHTLHYSIEVETIPCELKYRIEVVNGNQYAVLKPSSGGIFRLPVAVLRGVVAEADRAR